MREAALQQVEKGLFGGPPVLPPGVSIVDDGEPLKRDPASRFGAGENEKLRVADGLKRISTNRASQVETPIKLPTLGHLRPSIKSLMVPRPKRKLALGTADHGDAYWQLPLIPDHRKADPTTL